MPTQNYITTSTGLYYYRNRWYDPETGRFISEDPIGFAGGDINLYGYVWNSPYSFRDLYGDIPLASLLSRLFSAGTSTTMLASYVNAPGPGDPVYSPGGKFAGQTIDDVVGALRSGNLKPSDVPIDFITRNGNTLILNTRSAQALTRAGIPRSKWNAVNRTGQRGFERRLNNQLRRNKLTDEGVPSVRSSN